MPDVDAMVTGERLSLRAGRPGDEQRWFELLTDPAQLHFGTPAFVTPPDSLMAATERIERSRERWSEGDPGVLVVVDNAEPDRLIADIAWRFDLNRVFRTADVGYAVHPDERGRGVASAALALMVRWLLHDEDGPALTRVQLDHSVENPASCHVALSAGLAREGVRRGYLPLRDPDAPDGVRRHDVCQHGVLGDD